jgi:hypothetical protein
MGWAKPSQPAPVTGPSQWPGWAKQQACTKFTRVATLFKWIKIHLNSVMLIKAKPKGMKMKVQYFSSYSSVLLLLLSCYSSVMFLRVCMLELDDKASYSFPVFPSPSFSFFFFFFFFCTFISPLFTWIVETWKCRRRRSCAPLVTGRRKLRASGYWKKCCNTVWKKQLGAASSPPALQTQ